MTTSVEHAEREAHEPGGPPELRLRDEGTEVQQVQLWLRELGHEVVADGVFGPATARAVHAFQSSAGLQTTGVVDEPTWNALGISPSVRSALSRLPSGEVTSAAIVARLLELHPEYGRGKGGKLTLDVEYGPRAPATEWIARVRANVDRGLAPRLHGRTVIAALLRLDGDLAAQLDPDFVSFLHDEIREPVERLFVNDAVAAALDFVAHAAADVPSTKDVLGHGPLVDGLYTLLTDRRTSLPLALAVSAPWGAGKSSVMAQLKARLEDPWADPPPERRWHTVQFDAWKYERSERLWAALAKAIYEQPQAGMGRFERWRFRLRLERARLGLRRLLAVTLWPLLAAAAAVVGALSADLSADGTAVALLTTIAAAFAALTRYWGLITDPFKRAIERHARRPDYESHLGFTSEADADIAKLMEVLAPDDGMGVAVLVDDLDRCSSAHVVEVVEAMNQIFNAAQHRCAFVLGLDRDIVATNIAVAYRDTVQELRAEGSPLAERFGYEFLAKLVQLSVAIPQPSIERIQDLLASITGNRPPSDEVSDEAVRDAKTALRDAEDGSLAGIGAAARAVGTSEGDGAAMDEAVKRLRAERLRDSPEVVRAEFAALEHLERNPRQVKRFHNAFRLQLFVANADPLVPFDFTPEQLVALGKWVALRLRWPKLGDHLLRDPDLVEALERVAADDALRARAREPSFKHAPEAERERLAAAARYLEDPGVRRLMADRRTASLRELSLRSFLRVA